MKTNFKITKRFLSVLLAVMMVVGMMPFSTLTVNAASGASTKVTIDGLEYTFTLTEFSLRGNTGLLNTTSNLKIDYQKSGNTIKFGINVDYVTDNKTVTCQYFDGIDDFSFSDSNCENAVNKSTRNAQGASKAYATVSITRAASTHTGGTSCSSPKCTRCGTSYMADNHEKPNEFTYSVSSDPAKHDVKYACCGATKETAAHSLQYSKTADDMLTETCAANCGHTATATLTADDKTYTGSAITNVAIVTYDDNWQGEKPTEFSYSNNLNASTEGNPATATITINGYELSDTFQITQAIITDENIVLTPENGTYTGTAFEPKISVVWNGMTLVNGTDYTISWDKTGYETPDTYTARVLGIGNFTGSVDRTFTINAASLSNIKVEQTEALAYTGKAQTPTVSASAVAVNNQPITFTYSMEENGRYDKLPSFTNAGTYTVYYKASAPNHNDKFGSFTVTVNKAEATYASPTANNLTYNSNPQYLITAGSVAGGEMRYALGTDASTAPTSGWSTTVPQGTDAGTYYVWYKVVGDRNHDNVAPVCVDVEIQKAIQTAPVVSKTDETISEKNDGIITGVNSAMEYRREGETTYTAITGTEVTGLADGTYFVRYGETNNFKASPETEVTISAGRKLTVTLPENQVGYKLTTTTPEMDWYGTLHVEFKLLDGYSMLNHFEIWNESESMWQHFNQSTGTLQLTFVGNDFDFTVAGVADITAPDAEIQLAYNKWSQFWNDITFGLFFKKTQDVTITAGDTGSGVDAIYYYLSNRELALDEVRAIINWQEYNGTFKISPENKYVIYAKVVDKDGNSTYINSKDGVVLDSVVPVISGIENGATYYTTQKFAVTDDNLDSITINGNVVTEDFILVGNTNATYTIVATDKAGNSTTVTVTVKPISAISAPIDTLTKDNVNSSHEQTVDEVKAAVEAVDTSNATEEEKAALKAMADKAAELEKVIDDTKAEIARTNTELGKYDNATVNSDDAEALEQLSKDMKALLDGGNLTEAERTALTENAGKVATMQKTVADTGAENKRISDKIDDYDLATVTSDDKADLEQLLADIEKQLASTNLTEEEISELNGDKKAVEDLLTKIKGTDELIDKLTEDVNGYSNDTVKSTDKDAIEQIIKEIDALLETENLAEDEKKALEDSKDKAEGLLETIDKAEKATETENTEKVKDVIPENVTPENKTDLEKAKDDLEKALEDYGDNYTDNEKKAIEDDIKRIDEALEIIENVETVEELIGKIPENITKNDEAAIKAADDAYNALSDYEKSLVDEDAKKALDDAKAALAELNKPTGTDSPNTGDSSKLWLWFALLFVSGIGILAIVVYGRKRKNGTKR